MKELVLFLWRQLRKSHLHYPFDKERPSIALENYLNNFSRFSEIPPKTIDFEVNSSAKKWKPNVNPPEQVIYWQ